MRPEEKTQENCINTAYGASEAPKQKKMLTRKTKRAIFFACLIVLPMIQWVVMYAYVNFNTFRLAFIEYEDTSIAGLDSYIHFAGFDNFKYAFMYLFGAGKDGTGVGYLYKNSAIFIVASLIFKQTLSLLFSFYIYKKFPLAGLFKVILFLPSILSSLVFAQSFKVITDDVYSAYVYPGESDKGLLSGFGYKYRFPMMIAFNMWLGFGVQMLIYSGGMSNLDESMVEAAQIDGATVMKEFWYITLPLMLNQVSTFLITGLVAFFTNQISLYDFFGSNAGFSSTIGYIVYCDTLTATYYSTNTKIVTFSQLSAIGLIESLFLIPAVTLMRWALKKFGPKY